MSPRKRPTSDGAALDHFATGSGVDARMNALGPNGEETDREVLIPLDALVEGIAQPRAPIRAESVATLVEQIRAIGLLNAITVRPVYSPDGVFTGRYEIVAGHRRVAAYRILAATDTAYSSIRATVRKFSDLESVVATQVENLGRAGLSLWETARGMESLRRALVAAKLPSSVGAIQKWLGESSEASEAVEEDGAGKRKRKTPSRGGVSQYLRIGAVVTEELCRAAGVTVSGDATGDLDYDLLNRMQHAPLLRIAQAPADEQTHVLREEAAKLRAPAKPRARRAKQNKAVDVASPDALVPPDAVVPPDAPDEALVADDIGELGSLKAIKRLTPEEAQRMLDTLWPKVAALAEVAGQGDLVVAAGAGSGIVAFIRSADPATQRGQYILRMLGERMATRHAELNDATARTNTFLNSAANWHTV